jgi:[ribosomal protein S5]-alanine N-acetyltransferase
MKEFYHSVFDAFPVLTTPRLTLREILPEDAKRIYDMRSSGRVNEFIARPNMNELAAAENLVERTRNAYNQKMAIGWAGLLRDGQEIIGTCGFNTIEPQNLHAEIGGEMATEYWGKGIALEAVKAILHFGINTLNLQTIEAKVSPQNRSAIYVMEQLGFVKEAHYKNRILFNGEFKDMAVYTLHSSNTL